MTVIHFNIPDKERLSPALATALEAVSMIGDCGMVVAPPDPTPDMLAAACQAAPITKAQARKIWAAMVAAW